VRYLGSLIKHPVIFGPRTGFLSANSRFLFREREWGTASRGFP
jgi:hypothetical protein